MSKKSIENEKDFKKIAGGKQQGGGCSYSENGGCINFSCYPPEDLEALLALGVEATVVDTSPSNQGCEVVCFSENLGSGIHKAIPFNRANQLLKGLEKLKTKWTNNKSE